MFLLSGGRDRSKKRRKELIPIKIHLTATARDGKLFCTLVAHNQCNVKWTNVFLGHWKSQE